MQYREALEWLYGTQRFGIKMGLENVRNLLDRIETRVGEGNIRYIHVAGTNGKGSVCAMLDSICRQAGWHTGLYTSPHLLEFGERIRVDGEQISPAEIAEGLTLLRRVSEDWSESPTFFEYATVLALRYFLEKKVAVAVIETGMGGRLDSTNIVQPVVSVITPIDLDHQRWLGHEIEDIASEKAGIIKPGRPVVSAPQSPRAAAVLEKIARVRGSDLRFVQETYAGEIGLIGAHQQANAALAVAALRAGGLEVTDEHIRAGLAGVRWKGRFQRIEPRLVLDGAHNGAAMKSLAGTWQKEFGAEKATVVFGILEDKDIVSVLRELGKVAGELLIVPVQSARAADPERVRELAAAVLPGLPGRVWATLPEALAAARSGPRPVLLAGSLFLVGEALAHLENRSELVVPSEQ